MATKKVEKKVEELKAPKPVKVVKTPKPVKSTPKVKLKDTTKKLFNVQLVSFEMSAVIPTQQYGNFQPKVVVTAPTLEEARAVVMPFMVDLYQTYAELPLNGKEPKFFVKVEEKVINVEVPVKKEVEAPKVETPAPVAPPKAQEEAKAPVEQTTPVETEVVHSEPFKKAEKAISLAMSQEALDMIEEQIKKSVKIDPNDKPVLYTMILKKQKEVQSSF